jgi:hypothetical protein
MLGRPEIMEEQIIDPHIEIPNHDIGGVILLDERIRIEGQLGFVEFLLKGFDSGWFHHGGRSSHYRLLPRPLAKESACTSFILLKFFFKSVELKDPRIFR